MVCQVYTKRKKSHIPKCLLLYFSGFLRISDLEMWDVTVLGMSPFQAMATPVAQLRSRKQELAPSPSLRREAKKLWQRKVCMCFLPSGNELTRSCRSRSKYPVFLPPSLAHSQTGPSGGGRKEMHWPMDKPGQGPPERGESSSLYGFSGEKVSFSPSTFLSRLIEGPRKMTRSKFRQIRSCWDPGDLVLIANNVKYIYSVSSCPCRALCFTLLSRGKFTLLSTGGSPLGPKLLRKVPLREELRLPDSANENTGCPSKFEFQINSK